MQMTPHLKYHHQYHQAIVYKIFMSRKSRPEDTVTNYADALAVIKGMHSLSRGMKQIVYLVGWQYEGHDSKYPAWFEANKHLMRPEDTDPRDGFRWIVREAKAFNAAVSVHINMDDAYENSPLWDEYVTNDLIIKNADGSLMKGDIWDGERCYWICKTREWNCGLAQKRIDRFLEYMPEIIESGTVHIDAFRPNPSAFHGVGLPAEIETARNIYSYWHSKGVDVTNEYLSYHDLVGYMPLAWALNLDEQSRLRYPPSLICGGHDGWNQRSGSIEKLPGWAGAFFIPEAGTKYEEAWGTSGASGDIVGRKDGKFKMIEDMLPLFCEKTLPWYFLNRHRALELRQTAETYEVLFSEGIVSSVRVADRMHRITQNGRLLVDGGDLCIPAGWLGDGFLIAWSRNGAKKVWTMPPEWHGVSQVQVSRFDTSGIESPVNLPASQGRIELDMPPMTAFQIKRGNCEN